MLNGHTITAIIYDNQNEAVSTVSTGPNGFTTYTINLDTRQWSSVYSTIDFGHGYFAGTGSTTGSTVVLAWSAQSVLPFVEAEIALQEQLQEAGDLLSPSVAAIAEANIVYLKAQLTYLSSGYTGAEQN